MPKLTLRSIHYEIVRIIIYFIILIQIYKFKDNILL